MTLGENPPFSRKRRVIFFFRFSVFSQNRQCLRRLDYARLPRLCFALFLQNRQSPNEPQPAVWPGDLHAGEFATYKWCCPDMRDKGYVFTLFTTPFVFHSLNIAKELPFEIVSTPEFDKMISLAVNHFTLHEENN